MPMYCDLLTKKLIFELVTRINTHDLTISEDNWFLQIFLVHFSILLIKNTVYSKNKKVKKHEKKIKKYTCMGLNNFHLKVNALSQVNKKLTKPVFGPFWIESTWADTDGSGHTGFFVTIWNKVEQRKFGPNVYG